MEYPKNRIVVGNIVYQRENNAIRIMRRRTRMVYTKTQLLELEKEFHVNKYVCSQRRFDIAASIGLTERQVRVWFQNRRIRHKCQSLMSENGNKNKGEKGGETTRTASSTSTGVDSTLSGNEAETNKTASADDLSATEISSSVGSPEQPPRGVAKKPQECSTSDRPASDQSPNSSAAGVTTSDGIKKSLSPCSTSEHFLNFDSEFLHLQRSLHLSGSSQINPEELPATSRKGTPVGGDLKSLENLVLSITPTEPILHNLGNLGADRSQSIITGETKSTRSVCPGLTNRPMTTTSGRRANRRNRRTRLYSPAVPYSTDLNGMMTYGQTNYRGLSPNVGQVNFCNPTPLPTTPNQQQTYQHPSLQRLYNHWIMQPNSYGTQVQSPMHYVNDMACQSQHASISHNQTSQIGTAVPLGMHTTQQQRNSTHHSPVSRSLYPFTADSVPPQSPQHDSHSHSTNMHD